MSYCFCKKGKQGNARGFMIFCESCQVWFHGRCVGIKKEEAEEIEDWYCKGCLEAAVQCANPTCVNEANRDKSKYCSDDCGRQANILRYEKFFKPRWEKLEQNHSIGRVFRLKELERLEKEKDGVIQLIRRLKNEKQILEEDIKRIKDEAKQLRKDNNTFKENDDDDADMDSEDQEETVTSEQSKVYCLICGLPQPAEKAFKHWAACHRKQESNFNFTSDVQIKLSCPGVDEEPNLFCQRQDKKTKRYCMHIESACPQHSNWLFDKDEVCGCPSNINQNLVADGDYCLELKKECRLHYNWDRFRLASKNMERIQAFSRLDLLHDRIIRTQHSLNDTYGGVVGVMKITTIDHLPERKSPSSESNDNDADVDIEVRD